MSATALIPQGQSVVGPIVTGSDVEHSILSTLQNWLVSYLRECEKWRGLDIGALPEPRGWLITGRELEKYTSDQLPCVIVMAGGVTVKPLAQGFPGSMTFVWTVDVGTIWNAAWGKLTRDHAQLMLRCIALTLVQRPLDTAWHGSAQFPCVVDYVGETYDEIDFGDTRTYSAGVARFTVEVEDVMWRAGGPPPYVTPGDANAFDQWVDVKETGVTVNKVPITTEAQDE